LTNGINGVILTLEEKKKGLIKMYSERKKTIEKMEKIQNSKVILYVTGDRRRQETSIAKDVINIFSEHLDKIGETKKITLILYTNGGDTLAAWNIVNMIREYTDSLEVVVLHKALSAGSLIALGAEKIIMSKQSILGPIDPSVYTPLNPVTNNKDIFPISVEDISGYMDFAREELAINKEEHLKDIYVNLTTKVHPLVVGKTYRVKNQIKMLAEKLIAMSNKSENSEQIISFLCSESGSHDYTISKTEATKLGLPVAKPSEELYELMKKLYYDLQEELQLDNEYNPMIELGNAEKKEYELRRGVLESVAGGSYMFLTKGVLSRSIVNNQLNINNAIQLQKWEKVH